MLRLLPFSLPMWAHWLLIVAGGVAAILAVMYLVGVIFGKKYGHEPSHIKTRCRSSVVFAVMALCAILTACSTNTAVDAGDAEAGSNASVDLLSQSGFDYSADAFAVNCDDEELREWFENLYRDDPNRSLDKLKTAYAGECAPANEEARLAACRQAMQQYVDPQSNGLENPVAFPVMKAFLETYYTSGEWASMTWEEKRAALDEVMLDFVWLTAKEPTFCGHGVAELARHEVVVRNNQSWLPAAIEQYADSYLRTDEPIGNAIWFEQDDNGVILLKDEYINMALRVARVFKDNFEYYEEGPIQAMPTEHNWWLMHYDSANLAHVTDNPSQICVDSIILVDKYAEPGNGVTIGICLFDQRLQTYDTVEPTIVSLGAPESPATPQEPDTPNPGTPTTPDTPTVKPPDITITIPVEPDNPTPKPPVTVVTKKPSSNATNQGNANLGGGDKAVTDDGVDEYQPEKVPEKNYPTQGSSGDPANTPNTSAGSPTRQETSSTSQSSTTVRPDGKTESSGNKGQDHAVTNPSGGATSGGTPPAKDVNKPNTGTQSVSTTTNNSQSGGSTSQTTKVESTVGETIGTANGGAANKTPLPD